MKKIYKDKNNKYGDILTAIENALEKDIIYFNSRNASTDFNLVEVKEKIKKVEFRLKYLNEKKRQKQMQMIKQKNIIKRTISKSKQMGVLPQKNES